MPSGLDFEAAGGSVVPYVVVYLLQGHRVAVLKHQGVVTHF